MGKQEIYFIDHYDSFSFNVVDWLRGRDSLLSVRHIQFDDLDSLEMIAAHPLPLVISPGPRHPAEAVSTAAVVRSLWGKVPILGICLGHQILGQIAGFDIDRAAAPSHGSVVDISVAMDVGLFSDLPQTFKAATYHSLVVRKPSKLSEGWQITAYDQYGEIQALQWQIGDAFPAFGVQFHPESFLSEYSDLLRVNWLTTTNLFFNQK